MSKKSSAPKNIDLTASLSTVEAHSNNQRLVREAIQNIAVGPDRGRDISSEMAESVMSAVLNNEIDEVQTAIFLIALRMKRESMDEFLGLYKALAARAETIEAAVDTVYCLADPFDGYLRNATMTPFIPAVLAANGMNVVMHGVKTVGPKHGVTAHKVYELVGAQTALTPISAAGVLEETGCCYVDQSRYSPALYALQDLRHRIVKRTALTTLERMLIPIKGRASTRLILGYVHKAYPDIYARVAFAAGFDQVLLLKGVEGGLAPALNKPLRRFHFDQALPNDVNAAKQVLDTPFSNSATCAAMPMNSDTPMVEQCLETGLSVLNGANGVARDSLILACAQILNAHHLSMSFESAVEKVRSCLDNGSALERFQMFVKKSS